MPKPRATLLDRIVGWYNPAAGVRRALARNALIKARAYEGASTKDGWIPRRSGASANADHAADAPMLRARARSLAQNNPYAIKGLNSLVGNIIGDGITPESPDERVNELWQAWAQVADADGLLDIYGLQSAAYRAMETDGEVLIRLRARRAADGLPVPLQLQLLEIDYLDSAKTAVLKNGGEIVNGIETGPLGNVEAYWLFDHHPGDGNYARKSSLKSRRIPSAQIIHLMTPSRPGQRRGVTRLAPVIARLRDLAIYEDAELSRKQNEALFSVLISGNGEDFAVPNLNESPATAAERAATLGELGNLRGGAILATNGQQITVAEPHAAPGYADYLRTQLYAIAAGMGITYEMLTGDLSQVNFSSARVGVMEFRRAASQTQWQIIVPKLLNPIWHAFLNAADLTGLRIRDRSVEWTPPRWGYVNPMQDVKADAAEIASGLSSISEKLRQRGYQPKKVFAEMGSDYEQLKSSGALDLILLAAGKTKQVQP